MKMERPFRIKSFHLFELYLLFFNLSKALISQTGLCPQCWFLQNCQDVPVRTNRQDNSDKLLVKRVALRYEFSALMYAAQLSTVRCNFWRCLR